MRNRRSQKFLWFICLSFLYGWLLLPVFESFASDKSDSDISVAAVIDKSSIPQALKMNADKVNFDYETGVSHFSENVNIEYHGVKLFANEATVSLKDKKAKASGQVLIVDGNKIYCCESIDYNFDAKKGLMLNGSTMENAWILTGDRVNQIAKDRFIVENCRVSVCGNDHPHFFMTAPRVEVESGKYLIAHDVLFWMGPVPIFYWPYYKQRLDKNENFFNLRLGHSSLLGGYVSTRFHYPVTDNTDLNTNVNYYSKRGVGFELNSKTVTEKSQSLFRSFYIQDKKFTPTLSQEKPGSLVRHRLHFQNNAVLSDWQSSLDLNRLSDADVLNDYYKSESNATLQVDHQYRLSKTNEFKSQGVYIRMRANDFYSALERAPEFYYDRVPFEIIDYSNVYFSSTNSASFLKRRPAESPGILLNEPSLFRGYTRNALTYTDKFFDWLSFNPEAGLETIVYSKSIGKTGLNDGGNLLRWAPFFGMHFSTNLWKRYDTDETLWDYTRFRHVLTPGIGYSYQPKPSSQNSEIIQMDELDNRVKKQEIALELISRWQAKDSVSTGETPNLFNTRYSIPYNLDADTDPWGNFAVESEWRPTKDFKADVRLSYDFQNEEVSSVRTDLSWRFENIFGVSLGYWYRPVEGSLITPELSLNIGDDWFLRGYCHYNDESQIFERKEIAIIKSLHCLDLSLRFYERDFLDEKGFYITLSPKNITSGAIGYSE